MHDRWRTEVLPGFRVLLDLLELSGHPQIEVGRLENIFIAGGRLLLLRLRLLLGCRTAGWGTTHSIYVLLVHCNTDLQVFLRPLVQLSGYQNAPALAS